MQTATENPVTENESPVTTTENENENPVTESTTEAAPKKSKGKKSKGKKSEATTEAEPTMTEASDPEYLTIDSSDKEALSAIHLPESEEDPAWDPKMLLPVPDSLVTGLAVNGWDPSMPLKVRRGEDGALHIINGRTKFRALDDANKRRKANKLPALVIPVIVTNMDEIDSMGISVALNEHQQHIDPMTRAKSVRRLFSAGYTEDKIAEVHGIKLKQVSEYDALNDLPAKVQKLVASGEMALTAALGLVHLDAKKVEAMAETLVEQAKSVGKVTAREVKKNLNDGTGEPDRLNAKGIKALIEEVEKSPPTALEGKHAAAVREAFVLALECVLDARKAENPWRKMQSIASGK